MYFIVFQRFPNKDAKNIFDDNFIGFFIPFLAYGQNNGSDKGTVPRFNPFDYLRGLSSKVESYFFPNVNSGNDQNGGFITSAQKSISEYISGPSIKDLGAAIKSKINRFGGYLNDLKNKILEKTSFFESIVGRIKKFVPAFN